MTKAGLARDLREYAGGDYIGKRKLREYLSCGDAYRDKIVEGLDYRIQGRSKLYLVSDVAKSLMEHVVKMTGGPV